ncbi:MAG: hypothetical protein AAFV53_00555 [Myxococcota bacterium]
MAELLIRHHGRGHISLTLADRVRVDVDPGRTRGADYVLLTSDATDRFEDALDVLSSSSAALIATPALADAAARTLSLGDRAVDLDDFERVRDADVRITALSAPPRPRGPRMFSPITDNLPMDPMNASVMGVGPRMILDAAMGLPVFGEMVRAGGQMLNTPGGDTARGYTLEFFNGGPTVSVMGASLIGCPDRSWLDTLNDAGRPDVMLATIGGDAVEGVVWAVRAMAPAAVVLFRDHDPYDGQGDNLPAQRFIDALREDAPNVEVSFLRRGDGYAIPLTPPNTDAAASA